MEGYYQLVNVSTRTLKFRGDADATLKVPDLEVNSLVILFTSHLISDYSIFPPMKFTLYTVCCSVYTNEVGAGFQLYQSPIYLINNISYLHPNHLITSSKMRRDWLLFTLGTKM